ncbi:MAG: adenylosuccinate synthetase, partial [Helicobacter apodemus]|nr:adenylosuccinate synthetase [Helicobacter apodemus]
QGKVLEAYPSDISEVKPLYKAFEGWDKTAGVRDFEKLPKNAKNYIFALEEFLGVKIAMISTSPDRHDTILRQ